MSETPPPAERAAQLLIDAAQTRQLLTGLPEDLRPTTVEDGYQIQHAGHRLANATLGPWKAGATSVAAQQFLGVDAPFIGRPHADRVLPDGATISISQNFTGTPGIEVEVGLVPNVALTDVPDDPLDFAPLVDAVGCFEIVESRFADMANTGAPSLIADNAIAATIVRGPSLGFGVDAIRALDQLEVALDIDGHERVASTGASALGHPLEVLRIVARRAIEWETPIAAGELVITGTCTGLTPPTPGTTIVGRFGDVRITASFVD